MKFSLTSLQLYVYSLKTMNSRQKNLNEIILTLIKRNKNFPCSAVFVKSRAVVAVWIHHAVLPLRNTGLFFFAKKYHGSDWAEYFKSPSLKDVDTILVDKEINSKHAEWTWSISCTF